MIIFRLTKKNYDLIKEYFLIIKYGGRSEYTLQQLRLKGAVIGKKVQLYSHDIFIDPTRPFLLRIGDYTKITHHVIILTHDYSLSVLRRKYGEWLGEGRETVIGNNCFIGMGSIILMGTRIGDNCIVGAGSVLRGTYPSDSVIVGNPARVVCSLDEYYSRRKQATILEAKGVVNTYRAHTGKDPRPQDLQGFKFLFAKRNKDYLRENNLHFNCTGDEPEEVEKAFFETSPYWNSFEQLLQEASEELTKK